MAARAGSGEDSSGTYRYGSEYSVRSPTSVFLLEQRLHEREHLLHEIGGMLRHDERAFAAGGGERVVLARMARIALHPLRIDQSIVLQPAQNGIDSAFRDDQVP